MADVEITVQTTGTDQARQAFADIGGAARNMSSQVSEAGKSASDGLTAFGVAAATTAAHFIGQFVEQVVRAIPGLIEFGGALKDMSDMLGVSAEQLQQWQVAGQMVGVSMQTMGTGLAAFERAIAEAADGNAKMIQTFHDLGVSVLDAQGNVKTASDLLPQVAEGMKNLGSQTERLQASTTLFNRGGREMVKVLQDGGEALQELGRNAKEMGAVLSEHAVGVLDKFGDRLDLAKQRVKVFAAELLASGIEKFGELIDDIGNKIESAFKSDAAVAAIGAIKAAWESLMGAIQEAIALVQQFVSLISSAGSAIGDFGSGLGSALAQMGKQSAADIKSILKFIVPDAGAAEVGGASMDRLGELSAQTGSARSNMDRTWGYIAQLEAQPQLSAGDISDFATLNERYANESATWLQRLDMLMGALQGRGRSGAGPGGAGSTGFDVYGPSLDLAGFFGGAQPGSGIISTGSNAYAGGNTLDWRNVIDQLGGNSFAGTGTPNNASIGTLLPDPSALRDRAAQLEQTLLDLTTRSQYGQVTNQQVAKVREAFIQLNNDIKSLNEPQRLMDSFGKLSDKLYDVPNSMLNPMQQLTDKWQEGKISSQQYTEQMRRLQDAQWNAGAATRNASDSFADINARIKEGTRLTDAQNEALQEFGTEEEKAAAASAGVSSANKNAATSFLDIAQANIEATKAIDATIGALNELSYHKMLAPQGFEWPMTVDYFRQIVGGTGQVGQIAQMLKEFGGASKEGDTIATASIMETTRRLADSVQGITPDLRQELQNRVQKMFDEDRAAHRIPNFYIDPKDFKAPIIQGGFGFGDIYDPLRGRYPSDRSGGLGGDLGFIQVGNKGGMGGAGATFQFNFNGPTMTSPAETDRFARTIYDSLRNQRIIM